MIQRTERFRPNLEARKIKGAIAYVVLVGAVAVGIIGLGGIARPHCEAIANQDGVEIVAVADLLPASDA